MRNIIFLLVLLSFVVAGCSGSSDSPVVPKNGDSLDSVPIIGLTEAGGTFNAIGMMGAYELLITDTDVQLVSKRSSAIGEGYIVSGAAFWTIAPCANCMNIKTYSLSPDGALLITFTMDHPFPAGDPTQPPTAANRLDLNIFDLAAVVAPTSDSGATPTTFSGIGVSAYESICFNPDGYTTELSNVISDTAALPYFLVVDEAGLSAHTFNKFAMGVTGTEFDLELNIAGGAVPAFDIFLTMGYGASAKKADRLTPKYYNPEFNRNAAWKVDVDVSGDWLDNDAVATNDVAVSVYDWQHNSAISTTDPYSDEADTSTIFAESAVSSVKVEIPGMTAAVPELLIPDTGTGAPDDPLMYTFAIANENLLPAGAYTGMVEVLDSRNPGVSGVGGETDTLVDTEDGVTLVWYNIPEFVTYQTFPATVIVSCGPITGYILDPPLANIMTVGDYADGQSVNITVIAESGGLGNIIQYEADFDYDGVTFVADASTVDGVFTGLGPIVVPAPCSSNTPLTFQVAFKAFDDCTIPNEAIFAVLTGQIDWCPADSVGNVSLTVNRVTTAPLWDLYWQSIDTDGPDGPWALSWTEPANAVEYAIYCDYDPGDLTEAMLMDNLVLVDTVLAPASTYQVPASHYTDVTGNVIGNTYVVKARSGIGVAASESLVNQPAYIMVTSFDTLNSGTYGYPGGTGNMEGSWKMCKEYSAWYTSSSSSYWFYVNSSNTYYNSPSRSLRLCGSYLGRTGLTTYPGHWMGITVEAPVLTDEEEREFEGMICLYYYNYNYSDRGVTVGETSVQPGLSWSGTDWDILQPKTGTQYRDYNCNQIGPWPFDESNLTGSYDSWEIEGYLNLTPRKRFGADFTEKYVGLVAYAANYYTYNNVHFDSLTIVVY